MIASDLAWHDKRGKHDKQATFSVRLPDVCLIRKSYDMCALFLRVLTCAFPWFHCCFLSET